MKYCEEYAALLDAYVDGELSPQEMARVRDHLDLCPDCRTYVDDALAMREAFPDAEDVQVPEGFTAGVMEAVSRMPQVPAATKNPSRRRTRRVWGGMAAAAACVVLLLQFALHSGRLPSMQTRASGGASVSASMEDSNAIPEAAALDDAAAIEAQSAEEDGQETLPESPPEEGRAAQDQDAATSAAGPAAGEDAYGLGQLPSQFTVNQAEKSLRNAVPEEQLSLLSRVEIPAEQAPLLAAYTPLTDESGRICRLLEPEDYDALLLALSEQDGGQVTVLYTPEAPATVTAAGSDSQEPSETVPLPTLVYLAEA